MTKKTIGSDYNNPNGELDIKRMVKIKHNDEIENFIRKFRVSSQPCPNKKLRPIGIMCFKCSPCLFGAFDKIKEYKTYYKVLGKKYLKEELDNDNES